MIIECISCTHVVLGCLSVVSCLIFLYENIWAIITLLFNTNPSKYEHFIPAVPRWRMPQTYSSEPRTLCGRGSSGAGCVSAVYSTCGISYNHVYVRVLGYGRRSLDAFDGPHHRRPLWEWSSCPLHANLLEEGNTFGPLQLDSLRLSIPPTLFLPVLVWVEELLHLQGKWLLLWRWESWPTWTNVLKVIVYVWTCKMNKGS